MLVKCLVTHMTWSGLFKLFQCAIARLVRAAQPDAMEGDCRNTCLVDGWIFVVWSELETKTSPATEFVSDSDYVGDSGRSFR